MLDRLVTDGELCQVVANHVGLDLNLQGASHSHIPATGIGSNQPDNPDMFCAASRSVTPSAAKIGLKAQDNVIAGG